MQPLPLEGGYHFGLRHVRLCVLMESDLCELRDGDVCPVICLETGLQKEKKAFKYGSTFFLHGLEGRPVTSL